MVLGPVARHFEGPCPTGHSSRLCYECSIMTTQPSPCATRDPTQLNLEDEQEMRFWIEKFGCTEKQLKAAVKKIGSHPPAIRAELGRRVPFAAQSPGLS